MPLEEHPASSRPAAEAHAERPVDRESDNGLRQLLTWTFVVLVVVVLLAVGLMLLVTYLFDSPV